jgi:phosphoglycolate phosphatase-like HAD superfamily hydrolase
MKVIIDIDNTLCINNERFALAKKENGKINWDIAHDVELVKKDKPFYPMIDLAKKYKKDGFEVIILTGRPESIEKATEDWLKKYEIEYDQLIMRNRSSYFLKAPIYKKKVYETIIKSDVFCAYDDEEEIIQMWNRLGIPAFKVYGI